ncbi:MAG: flavodoxin family protein [Defluviitaleaceae bacterium]|nr:flavodoxin family protein [Defluviitaleaceae bacterium]
MMSKQILVITGSPRKGGNSDMLADAFIKGAEASGHTVDKFVSADHQIGGCFGCNGCWSKGTPCVQGDDFNDKLAPLLDKADMLVFCMPLYAYSFPTQIKGPLDRLFPYGKESWMKPLKVKESAMIVCGADDVEEAFHAVKESYRHLIGFFEWKNHGELVVLGVNDKGDVKNTDGLERAEAFGKGI